MAALSEESSPESDESPFPEVSEERSLVLESPLEESELEEEPESESPELSEEAPATPLARFQSLSTSSKLTV